MRQYGRQYRLELKSEKDILILDKLKISFSVTKDIKPEPNHAELTIYNLSRQHMQALLDGEYTQATLSVGYETLSILFSGDISKVKVSRQGLDFIMTFNCGDGLTKYLKSRSKVTIKAGSSDDELIKQLQKDFDLQTEAVSTTNKARYPRGQVLNGDTRALLNKVAKNNHAQWSIQNGKLLFLPIEHAIAETDIVVLSQETGLINAPEQTDSGLEVSCLLNPQVSVGTLVEVKSIFDYFNGKYKVVKVTHSGENLGGEWQSKLVLVGGKFKPVEKEKGK